MGIGISLWRFSRNVIRILSAAARNRRLSYYGAQLVLTPTGLSNFTFLKYIFINEGEWDSEKVEKELLSHELAHARQLHSLDVLFVEILLVILWFNPALYLYKRAIQLNHEYLADDEVLSRYKDPEQYWALLLRKVELSSMPLANNFNYLITKKRLIMMTKNFNKTKAVCKQFAMLPLSAIAFFLFSTRVEANVSITAQVKPSKGTTKLNEVSMVKPGIDNRLSQKTETKEKPVDVRTAYSSVSIAVVNPGKTANDLPANPIADQEPVITFVEIMPDFPGGMAGFKDYIANNTAFSQSKGTIEATFYVDKDGRVLTSGMPKGSDNENNRALLNAIEKSPLWRPAIQNGRPMKVGYTMNVSFEAAKRIAVEKLSPINEEMVVSFEKKESDGNMFVQGLVVDKEGQPLAGVSIRNADYKNLGVTDKSGKFIFKVADPKPLMFSSIGYLSRRINVD